MADLKLLNNTTLHFAEAAAPATPDAGEVVIYAKTDGLLYQKDDAGTETGLAAAAASAFVGCIATRSTDQTGIVSGTDTVVSFTGTDEIDTDAFHDPGSNPSRITIPAGKAGKYLLEAYVIWDGTSTGQRRMFFKKNGTTLVGSTNAEADHSGGLGYQQYHTAYICALAETDYVELFVTQNSGTNRFLSGGTVPLRFSAVLLGT